MKKIVKEHYPIERFELPREEARALMVKLGEPYKVELIDDLPEDAVIFFLPPGEFTDLCAGPHMENTGEIRATSSPRWPVPTGEAMRRTKCCSAFTVQASGQ
jgi:threonyl-tRNA synthetase